MIDIASKVLIFEEIQSLTLHSVLDFRIVLHVSLIDYRYFVLLLVVHHKPLLLNSCVDPTTSAPIYMYKK